MKHVTRYLLLIAIAVCAFVGAHDTAHAEARGKGYETRFDKDGNGVPDMTDRMERWQERKDAQKARRSPAPGEPATNEDQ